MNLSTIFTKENITFILATIGSIGTIISAILALIWNRKNISITITKLYKDEHSIFAYVLFENNSHLPISINRISLLYNDHFIHSPQMPENIFDIKLNQHKNGVRTDSVFSIQFPIYLSAFGCSSGYIHFEFPQEVIQTLPTLLTFQVGTNRGMVTKRKLSYTPMDSLVEL